MGKECYLAAPKPRKRRSLDDAETRPPRNVSLADVSQPKRTTAADDRTASDPNTLDACDTLNARLLSRSDLYHTESKSFISLFCHGLGLDPSNELLRGVDYSYVQTCFTVFRQLACNFPFIDIRSNADGVSMAASRPMLTVATCIVASAANPELQERLIRAFRLALSSKVLLDGEKSMDLLTGLLVYLAWHHHYMSKQQIYQELCLLAGMAGDLGLYRQPPTEEAKDVAAAVELDRAFLGCYHLCCGLSVMGFNRPNPLRWTDNLRRCAEFVASTGHQPGDRTLIATTELMHAIDELDDTLRAESGKKTSAFTHYVDVHTKATKHRLKALKREHPLLSDILGFGAATIHLQHRLLRASETPDTATLIQCACTVKEYLDDLLSRPPILLHQIAILDFANLLEILILMAQISKPPPNAMGWEAGALSSMLQPDTVLDAVCAHMASAPVGDALAQRHELQLQWFRNTCENIEKRILNERTSSRSMMRNDESQYDTVHSLGQARQSVSQDAHFRPINEPSLSSAPTSVVSEVPSMSFDSFGWFDHGVLNEGFWNNFMDP